MNSKQYQEKLLNILHSMLNEEVEHCLFGKGVIVGFEPSRVLINFEGEVKKFSDSYIFDKIDVLSPFTQEKIDEVKLEYALSKNNANIKPKVIETQINECKSNVTFEDIIGLDDVKEQINKMIVYPFKYKDIYEVFKRTSGGGILLYGAPGTGKTMIAKAIANEINAKFFYVRCSDIVSKWFGESEQKIRELFRKARESITSIIFFDEFDALGSDRDNTQANSNTRIVSELLSQMDGYGSSNDSLLIIAATNKPWNIDSALLRSGRFDRKIYVDIPSISNIELLLKHEFKTVPTKDVEFEIIAKELVGFSSADVVGVCNEAKDKAISRSIEKGEIDYIETQDLLDSKKLVKSSICPKEIDKLINYCI